MPDQFSRTRMLLGDEGMEKLKNARVAVFGVGGVGGYAVEALVRSGVGTIDIFDNDTVCPSNLNRQIIATHETLGMYKTEAARERAMSINPDVKINEHTCFYLPENADNYDFTDYSYIIDAVDTVTAKIEIILRAHRAGVPVISCMGAGNKLDASKFEVTDIYKTSVCPLARVMRYELRKRGVKRLKVVYSAEPPIKPVGAADDADRKKPPGSIAYAPAVCGLIAAGEVIRDLAGK